MTDRITLWDDDAPPRKGSRLSVEHSGGDLWLQITDADGAMSDSVRVRSPLAGGGSNPKAWAALMAWMKDHDPQP